MTTENKKTTDQRGDSSVESTDLLAAEFPVGTRICLCGRDVFVKSARQAGWVNAIFASASWHDEVCLMWWDDTGSLHEKKLQGNEIKILRANAQDQP